MAKARAAKPALPPRFQKPLILIFGLAVFFAAVLALGKYTREGIRDSDRFAAVFTQVDCSPPPNQSVAEFLAEVQYLSELPDRLPILDKDLPDNLAAAFRRHPWVLKVEGVTVLPSRRLEVRLKFRRPVLEVFTTGRVVQDSSADETNAGTSGTLDVKSWFVDGAGIVLPRRKGFEQLPKLHTTSLPTQGSGNSWGNGGVEAAARLADFLRNHQGTLHIEEYQVNSTDLILLTSSGSRVEWGHAPGLEESDEAKAERKLERILHYCRNHSSIDLPNPPRLHDLRPLEASIHTGIIGPVKK